MRAAWKCTRMYPQVYKKVRDWSAGQLLAARASIRIRQTPGREGVAR